MICPIHLQLFRETSVCAVSRLYFRRLGDLLFARLQSTFFVVCVASDCLGLRHIDGKVESRFTPEPSFATASRVSKVTRNDMTL